MGSTSAFAELIKAVILGFLCMPVVIIVIVMILNGKKFFERGLKYLAFLSILPIIILLIINFTPIIDPELRYIGTYHLSQYPHCDSCTLDLKENNVYIVTKNDYQIEKGTWEYLEDEYLVRIGTDGRLGIEYYMYNQSSQLYYD